MRLKIILKADQLNSSIPIAYQYPLSAGIYRILSKANAEYASFLHEKGYGKGFKLFCFSDLQLKFKLNGDRMDILSDTMSFEVSFHLPEAAQNFIKGLFMSQVIDIADKKSQSRFIMQSVEALPNSFAGKKDNEVIQVDFLPASAVVAGIKNEKGNYVFLSPEDPRFVQALLHNWKEKIKTTIDEPMDEKVLSFDIFSLQRPAKSRLITVKAGTPEETKIRGWLNFGIRVTGEKRFAELLWNAGAGVYNSLGCGMIGKSEIK